MGAQLSDGTFQEVGKLSALERQIIEKQIEIIEIILAQRAHPNARAVSIKKIEAELEKLKGRLQ